MVFNTKSMKNISFLTAVNLLVHFFSYAQMDENQGNPFKGDRINYFKHTLVVFNEYLDTEDGSYNTTNIRLIVPIGNKSWNLRADLPIVTKNNDVVNKTELGDFAFGATYIPYIDSKKGIAIRTRLISNSSDNPNFGTGKWIVIPALFYGQFIGSERKFLWLSTIENQNSFAGSKNRNTINTTVYENVVFHYFGRNWIAADVTFRYNHTIEGFQNNAYLEYGRKLTPSNMVYIHPSVGFGEKRPYNYGVEIGTLILF